MCTRSCSWKEKGSEWSERDWEMRIWAQNLRGASAFKVLGRRRARLFRAEEGQKPPERGGCCINIYMRKEGLLCAEGREDEVEEDGGGKVEMKCKCLNELLRDYRGTSYSQSRMYLPLINARVIICYCCFSSSSTGTYVRSVRLSRIFSRVFGAWLTSNREYVNESIWRLTATYSRIMAVRVCSFPFRTQWGRRAEDDCISRLRLRKLHRHLNAQLDLHYEGKQIPPISIAH